jgi:hypothetical protein
VCFHIYNLRSFACEQYHIVFNLWSNGGANWVQEYRKFLSEENDQWKVVHRKKVNLNKSLRDVVKGSHLLPGANRVPMGRRKMYPQRLNPRHCSAFHRIEGLSRNHQKDHHNQVETSAFDRLKWLATDSLYHQKDHQVLDVIDHQNIPRRISCDERPMQKQNSNSKCKQPIDFVQESRHILGCVICSRSGLLRPTCHAWVRCHLCKQLGHVAWHYATQWEKTGNQLSLNHTPDSSAKNLSTTMQRMWVAKVGTAGEASGSNLPI